MIGDFSDGPQGTKDEGGPFDHTCPWPWQDKECLACGVRDCPSREALHYSKYGCPTCSLAKVEESPTLPFGEPEETQSNLEKE
jgi:hypothetical protein